jgi:hypothetical protein
MDLDDLFAATLKRTHPMRLIAMCGHKGAGKNYVANVARDLLTCSDSEVQVRFFAFAAPFKAFAVNALGIGSVYGSDEEKNTRTEYDWSSMPQYVRDKNEDKAGPMTVREVLQVLGTELSRDVWGKNIWIKAMLRTIQREKVGGTDYFFITDCRFPNEADMVKSIGGTIWKVTGDRSNGKDWHESELVIDEIIPDEVITNNLDDNHDSIAEKVAGVLGITIGSMLKIHKRKDFRKG